MSRQFRCFPRGGFGLAAPLQPHLKSTARAGLRLPWLSLSRSVRQWCWSGNGPLPDLDCGRRLARPRAVGSPCLYITGVLCKPPLASGFYRLLPANLAIFTQCRCPSREFKDSNQTKTLRITCKRQSTLFTPAGWTQ